MERDRQNAEAKRVVAETNRERSEQAREEREGLRMDAETLRQQAEEMRAIAEYARSAAEEARQNAEQARQEAEAARQLARRAMMHAEDNAQLLDDVIGSQRALFTGHHTDALLKWFSLRIDEARTHPDRAARSLAEEWPTQRARVPFHMRGSIATCITNARIALAERPPNAEEAVKAIREAIVILTQGPGVEASAATIEITDPAGSAAGR